MRFEYKLVCVYFCQFTYSIPFSKNIIAIKLTDVLRIPLIIAAQVLSSTEKLIWVIVDQCIGFFYSSWKEEVIDSRSLQSGPPNDVMLQSQLKPSHCCRHTPWLEQESSWQVVLGPEETDDRVEREREKQTDREKKRRVYKLTGPLQHKIQTSERLLLQMKQPHRTVPSAHSP